MCTAGLSTVAGAGGGGVSDTVGSFTVKGSLVGNTAIQAFSSVLGSFLPGVVMGKLQIGGDMIEAREHQPRRRLRPHRTRRPPGGNVSVLERAVA
jgi:hypothetical protein